MRPVPALLASTTLSESSSNSSRTPVFSARVLLEPWTVPVEYPTFVLLGKLPPWLHQFWIFQFEEVPQYLNDVLAGKVVVVRHLLVEVVLVPAHCCREFDQGSTERCHRFVALSRDDQDMF